MLYAPDAIFYSHPFRASQDPADAEGLVIEQRDAWADADGRHELPAWVP